MKRDFLSHAFNRANTYDQHNQLQQQTGNRLILLSKKFCGSSSHIIDLGCGTGSITNPLLMQYQFQAAYAIDIASDLLKQAEEILPKKNVHLLEANFNALPDVIPPLDFMFSNMALHWSPDIDLTFQHLATRLNHNGKMAFTIPLVNTFAELKPYFAVNHFYDCNAIEQYLRQAGFTLDFVETEKKVFHFSNTLAALRSIKKVGATHVAQRSRRALGGKALLQQSIQSLTYHIGYFVARRTTQ